MTLQSNHAGNVSRAVAGYLKCVAWADAPEGSQARFPAAERERAARDVADFVTACGGLATQAFAAIGYSPERFGHDFWLTRCGHGAGFWDRDELMGEHVEGFPVPDRDGKPYTPAGTLGDALSAVAYGTDAAISRFAYPSLTAYRGWLYFA